MRIECQRPRWPAVLSLLTAEPFTAVSPCFLGLDRRDVTAPLVPALPGTSIDCPGLFLAPHGGALVEEGQDSAAKDERIEDMAPSRPSRPAGR